MVGVVTKVVSITVAGVRSGLPAPCEKFFFFGPTIHFIFPRPDISDHHPLFFFIGRLDLCHLNCILTFEVELNHAIISAAYLHPLLYLYTLTMHTHLSLAAASDIKE